MDLNCRSIFFSYTRRSLVSEIYTKRRFFARSIGRRSQAEIYPFER